MITDPGPAPTPRCTIHMLTTQPAARCGACMDDRVELNDWTQRKRLYDAQQARLALDERLRIQALAINACSRCDDNGRAPNGMPCTHTTPARMPDSLRQLLGARP